MTVIPITLPLEFVLPGVSYYLITCLVCTLVTTISILYMAWQNPWRLARPALLFALFTAIFFQWPTVYLSDVIQASLPNAWYFAVVVNAVPLLLIPWASLTSFADLPRGTISRPEFTWWQTAVPVTATAVFGTIFLARVPFDCTAVFALIFDPKLTLLARELSIKLAGTSLATYSYGALANATAPVVLGLAGASIVGAALRLKVWPLIIWLAIVLIMVAFVMLSGAKGLLVPSFLVIVISSMIWNRNWLVKIISIVVMIGALVVGLTVLEVARERSIGSGMNYPFAACAVKLNACPQAKQLINSLLLRDASLGLAKSDILALQKSVERACTAGAQGEQLVPKPFVPLPKRTAADWFGRMFNYAWSIYYRIAVIPAQVASWHFLYVAEKGEPGIAALPFGRRMTGISINLPELVYQEYGSIFSSGDRTSTSTSPTSFALAYAAYVGWGGLLLAIGLMLWLDFVATFIIGRLSAPFLGLAPGLMTVLSMNLVLSDYVTVLVSHGGAAALALLTFYAATKDRGSFKRFFDVAFALLLAVVFAIPGAIIALLVRLRLGAPVLFSQVRPGLNSKPFTLYKFRTMTDARGGFGRLLSDEQRLTAFGRFLRSTSLDELPELWNVLRGDMSLVGPRPLLMEYLPRYSSEQARRHEVRPGITGWAQINGRNELDWEDRFRLDVWYVDNQSFWLDLKIMFLTLGKIFRREGISSPGSATMEKFQG